jgi:hypothetical protein
VNEDVHSDLFEIRLNENGIRYIRKFVILTRFIVLAGIISSMIIFVVSFGRIFFDVFDYSILDAWQTLYFRLTPFFAFLLTVFYLFQLFYYWRIKRLLEDAIESKNEILFNASFLALLKNAGWGLVLGITDVIVCTFDLLFFVNYY